MQIQPSRNDLSFSLIDRPIEAFLTPPNDPFAGLLMDHLPKDGIEIKGSVGGKDFNYRYSLEGDKISINGRFDNIPLSLCGVFKKDVSMNGRLGDNLLNSTILPKTQGPENTGKAGTVTVKEKIDVDLSAGAIYINGAIGEDNLKETIKLNDEGTKIIDMGEIGDLIINRQASRIENGFHLTGTIGDLPFEEFIIADKTKSNSSR